MMGKLMDELADDDPYTSQLAQNELKEMTELFQAHEYPVDGSPRYPAARSIQEHVLQAAKNMVSQHRVKLKHAVLAKAAVRWKHDLDDGTVDTWRKLPQIAAGVSDGIYAERSAGRAPQSAIMFVLDVSGSMQEHLPSMLLPDRNHNPKSDIETRARQAGVTLPTEFIDRVQYTNLSRARYTGALTLAIISELAKYRSETGVLGVNTYRYLIKPLGLQLPSGAVSSALTDLGGSNGTQLELGVMRAFDMLSRSRLQRRLMFVITDGENHSEECLKRALSYAEAFNTEIIGFGIGEDYMGIYAEYLAAHMYGTTAEELADGFGKVLDHMVLGTKVDTTTRSAPRRHSH